MWDLILHVKDDHATPVCRQLGAVDTAVNPEGEKEEPSTLHIRLVIVRAVHLDSLLCDSADVHLPCCGKLDRLFVKILFAAAGCE